MTSIELFVLTWRAPLARVDRAFRHFQQRRAQLKLERLAVQTLSDLNDYELWDIGLTRGEIRAAVAGRLDDRITTTRAPHGPRNGVVLPTTRASSCGGVS